MSTFTTSCFMLKIYAEIAENKLPLGLPFGHSIPWILLLSSPYRCRSPAQWEYLLAGIFYDTGYTRYTTLSDFVQEWMTSARLQICRTDSPPAPERVAGSLITTSPSFVNPMHTIK